ncbi:ATPase subunit of ABC transporter with duplicated ATPase domains [Salirhabdus euzebyi]|uniref:ATPase subunit of ABC transporter with duplicated ATPase domains n=1 Tax=Salirhabdus euzebyi TaxID=394506 RepID=A0A841Q6T8_9BACI|nr:ABC-F type ribosomal protection protein [Salirhabdus euzebyi]MBB6454118.1 ATPase subunit of ABC transporter with duplicated ATPase domains [Salirhabdus euzebyi]
MYILKTKNLRKEVNGETLFENVSIEIKKGEHVALYGRNGVGKTTLIKGLLGRLSFEHGDIHVEVPKEEWGLLEQSPDVSKRMTTKEFILNVFPSWFELKEKVEYYQNKLHENDSNREEVWKLYEKNFEKFLELGGYDIELVGERALLQTGIDSTVWDVPFHQLSGGQKTKVQMAKLLIKEPKFILMDEPTNHLDKETMEWLEGWLNNYDGAVLFVSHDRYFLDKTAHSIYELTTQGCKLYPGGYTSFKEQKEIEYKTQEKNYQKYKKKKQELEATIRRYQQWFQKAHTAAGTDDFLRAKANKNVSRFKAKESELDRLEKEGAKKPKQDKGLNMTLNSSGFSARTLLQIQDLSFSYKEKELFGDVSFSINREDRIAVIGPNGVGKSTLLKLLINRMDPKEGVIKRNPQTRIGYFDQELAVLNKEETLLESLLSLPEMTQTEARTILGSFMFKRDAVFKKIADLSMGEKCRAAFLKLYFSEANLLVLDEPTNYLDIDTRETVEDVLQSYPGAIICVSHDRYFIKKVANRILFIDGKQIVDYRGSYPDFVDHLKNKVDSGKKQWMKNEREKLEFRLVELMTMDESSILEHSTYWDEIKETKLRIEQLKE